MIPTGRDCELAEWINITSKQAIARFITIKWDNYCIIDILQCERRINFFLQKKS